MQKTGKVVVGVVAILVMAGGVAASIRWSQRDLITVQTSRVIREDITSVVTAAGEIKPRKLGGLVSRYSCSGWLQRHTTQCNVKPPPADFPKTGLFRKNAWRAGCKLPSCVFARLIYMPQ